LQPSLASIVIDREHQRRRIAGSAGRTMTMIADPATETFMIGDDGELLGSAWFIDDRDQQRTHYRPTATSQALRPNEMIL
jgi:hypothetical protein